MTCFCSGNAARHHHTVNVMCGDGMRMTHFCWALHAGAVCPCKFSAILCSIPSQGHTYWQGIWTLAIALYAPFVRKSAIYIAQVKAFVMDFRVLYICVSFHRRRSWVVSCPSRLLIGKNETIHLFATDVCDFCYWRNWLFTCSFIEWKTTNQWYVHRPQRWKEAPGSSGRPHRSITGERGHLWEWG